MDKQARKLTAPREEGAASEAGSEGGSNEESDGDEKVRINLNLSFIACYLHFEYNFYCVNVASYISVGIVASIKLML